MAIPDGRATTIAEILDGYMEAFNANDLDRVMTYFAEDAVYRPGNGVERVGRAAIRAELEPQFRGDLGAMRFDETDRLVDERARKVAIRWVCRHDLAHFRPSTLSLRIQRLAVGAFVGDRFGWEGVDVLHFDAPGRIVAKFTYAGFTRPRLVKALGVPLPPIARPVGTARPG